MKNRDDRIDEIVRFCEISDTIADIGADHGITSLKLILNGKAKKTILSDISVPSLQKARILFMRSGILEKGDFRVGDGLSVLHPGEAQGILITGMGGLLIAELLKNGLIVAKTAKFLILSPHSFPGKLREFLLQNGFYIVTEKIVYFGKRFYRILKAAPGNEAAYTVREYFLGRNVVKDRMYYESLQRELRNYEGIRQKQGARQEFLITERIRILEEELASGNQI